MNLHYLARLVPGVFLVVLLTGCGSLQKSNEWHLAQSSVELTQVPFFPQVEYQCGPAALATVFQYRGQVVQPEDLIQRVYTPKKQGSLQVDMVSAVRQQGLVPYPIDGSVQALLQEVAAGNPVLVMQNLSFSWSPVWHYAVVIGYDLDRDEVILRSGETKRWLTSLSAFERTWQRADYWGLVIVEPSRIPQTAHHQAWLKTAFDLEQIGQIDAAKAAYQAGWQKWQTLELGMALGNLYYQQGTYDLSSQTFEALSRVFPQNEMVWNNWAYALKAQGCALVAKQAAQCAVSLNPEDKNVQSTLGEMQTTQALKLGCPKIECFNTRPGD